MNGAPSSLGDALAVALIVAAAVAFVVFRAVRAARGRKPPCCSGGESGVRKARRLRRHSLL
jgi:hypothetical protein